MKHAPTPSRAAAFFFALLLLNASHLPAQQRRRHRQAGRQPSRTATTTPPAARTNSTKPPATAATPNTVAPPPGRQHDVPAPASKDGAGQPHAARAGAPAEKLSFDTLPAADSYAIYMEVRAVGQQARPGGLMEIFQPFTEILGAGKSERSHLDFFNAHAEALADARVLMASMPAGEGLPQGFAAIEFPDAEAAQKFAAELEKQLVKHGLLAGARRGGANASPTPAPSPQARARVIIGGAVVSGGAPAPTPLFVKRVNELVLTSDAEIKLTSLRPAGSKPLTSQPNFRAARSRFPTEPLFVYADVALMRRSFEQMRKRFEEQARAAGHGRGIEEAAVNKPEAEAASSPEPSSTATPETEADAPVVMPEPETIVGGGTEPEPAPEELVTLEVEEHGHAEEGARGEAQLGAVAPDFLSMIGPFIFSASDGAKWPEAVSVAAAPEGDALAVRALLFNDAEIKSSILPLFPLLVSGPPLSHGGAALMPAETDILVSLSLDLARMYEQLTQRMARFEKETAERLAPPPPAPGADRGTPPPARADGDGPAQEGPAARLAALEKLFGFKIKEDLIDSLGNEVAIGIPASWMTGGTSHTVSATVTVEGGAHAPPASRQQAQPASKPTPAPTPPPAPVALVSVRDKGKLETILPRVSRALGLLGASGSGGSQRHRGVELISFGPYALALLDNYLAVATDEHSLRRLIDAREEGRTLGSTEDFRASVRWQPRQTLGQVYVSNALLKSFFAGTKEEALRSTEAALLNLVSRLDFDPGSITHAVTSEGAGPLHEVRLPRDLLPMFAAKQAVELRNAPARAGESQARNALFVIHHLESTHKAKKGAYAPLEELMKMEKYLAELLKNNAYRIELTISGDGFEATATPAAYPETGRRSFFIDQTGVLRAADKAGQRATSQDPPAK